MSDSPTQADIQAPAHTDAEVSFERITEIESESPTLIEGFPGHGLVASIAVNQINQQLDLSHHGNVVSDGFPPVASFEDGLVQDTVRVYSGTDPDVMTLRSDITLPPSNYKSLSRFVINQLSDEFGRAVFLAGAPAENEDEIGDVMGVATHDDLRDDLEAAGIPLGDEPGVVGGITGALANECYHAGIPAAVLIVRSHPYLPDPTAAQSVIENALEPLVEFDIDTAELEKQADEIRRQMEQIAKQLRQAYGGEAETEAQPQSPMYQ